jgi:hypothetical protein
MKKTPWFNAKKYKPVRNGWYEGVCKYGEFIPGARFYWNGKTWSMKAGSKRQVCTFGVSCDSWRGLTEPIFY